MRECVHKLDNVTCSSTNMLCIINATTIKQQKTNMFQNANHAKVLLGPDSKT